MLKKPKYNPQDWITREEALDLLKVKSNTLSNYINRGRIPARFISESPSGKKFFHKPGLMGFDN